MESREFLLRQIERAEEKLARLESLPDIASVPEDSVLWFRKRFSSTPGRVYKYAAVKHGGQWYLTSSRANVANGFTDQQLAEWIADGWPMNKPLDIWYATAWETVE